MCLENIYRVHIEYIKSIYTLTTLKHLICNPCVKEMFGLETFGKYFMNAVLCTVIFTL